MLPAAGAAAGFPHARRSNREIRQLNPFRRRLRDWFGEPAASEKHRKERLIGTVKATELNSLRGTIKRSPPVAMDGSVDFIFV